MPEATAASTRASLLTLEDVLQRLHDAGQAHRMTAVEKVSTFDALSRVLAQEVTSPLDVPPADNTSMDGYAVRCADVTVAGVVMPVSQRIAAGHPPHPLQPGTAARIFTGAFVPEGADAIVMQEQCEVQGSNVRIGAVPTRGQWIRRRGEDVQRGRVVLESGTRLSPQAMGLAAGVGAAQLTVLRRPRVALMSTGDELVMPGDVLPEAMPLGAIYNSNRFMLRGLLLACGCTVTDLGIVPDTLEATREVFRSAAEDHDLIVSSGGVSVGEEDHIRPALEKQGHVGSWQIAIKPGKPLTLGAVTKAAAADPSGRAGHPTMNLAAQETLFLGLPGNPVSSFVTFLLTAMPLLAAMQGLRAELPQAVPMRADFEWLRPDAKRREFLRVRFNSAGGLDLFPNQSSGVLTSAVWGDGLVDLAAGQTVARGDALSFRPWSSWGLLT